MATPLRRFTRRIRGFMSMVDNPLAQSWAARVATPDLRVGSPGLASFRDLCETFDGYRFNTIFEQLGPAAFDVVTAMDIEDLRPRGLYNPVPEIIDFYAKHVLTGQMSRPPQDDVSMLQDPDAAMPDGDLWVVSKNPAMVEAVMKVWRWSNLQLTKTDLATNCATYGNCLLIVSEIPPSSPSDLGRVIIEVSHPANLEDWDADAVGNLTYAKVTTTEYDRVDGIKQPYKYTREYTPSEFVTYKNHKEVSRVPNPHGFVPVVVARHKPVSGDFWGLNAFAHALPEIHELCIGASVLGQNILMHNDPRWVVLGAAAPSPGEDIEASDNIWYIPAGGKLDVMIPNLSIQDVYVHLGRLLDWLERGFPELTVNTVGDNKRDVSGAGVRGLMSGLIRRGLDARERYEEALGLAMEMAVAMGQRLGGTEINVFGAPVGEYGTEELDFEFHWPDIMPMNRLERLRIAAEEKTLELQIVQGESTLQLAREKGPEWLLMNGKVQQLGGNTPPAATAANSPSQGTPTQ